MQNRVRVRNRGFKSRIDLWLGLNSAALHLSLPDSAFCLAGLFKSVHFRLNEKHVSILASHCIIFAF